MDRTRYPKLLLAGLLFTLAAAAIFYGIFALVYRGDGSSRTYVSLAGHRLDAPLAGAISVTLGVSLAVCGRVIIKVGRGIGVWPEPTDKRMT
jgi:hypothetical protein